MGTGHAIIGWCASSGRAATAARAAAPACRSAAYEPIPPAGQPDTRDAHDGRYDHTRQNGVHAEALSLPWRCSWKSSARD